MARRRTASNPGFKLDSGDIKLLSETDIRSILRGASSLIASGGRTTLVKILRGSRAQKILAFETNPAYGSLAEDSQTLVEQKVDWCIETGYLNIFKQDGFPLLAYTDKGLMIECFTIAEESLICLQTNPEALLSEIRDYPLITVNTIFDLVAEGGPEPYAKALRQWEEIGTKRMRSRIQKIFEEWENKAPPERFSFLTCLLDEGISERQWKTLEIERKNLSLATGEIRYISDELPGSADVDIFEKLIAIPKACFITSDRPFHNALLEKKFPSFYYDKEKGRLNRHPIEGVKPRGIFKEMGQESIARHTANESEPVRRIPSFLFPKTEKQQKRARTKRRRIKNYFGGTSRMDVCRVTISTCKTNGKTLVGFKANITSNSNLKALDATESYLLCEIGSTDPSAFSIALGQLRLLGIIETLITFFYDTSAFPALPEDSLSGDELDLWNFLKTEADTEVTFVKTNSKSPKMAQLQKKLKTLSAGKSNEIVSFDYQTMLEQSTLS